MRASGTSETGNAGGGCRGPCTTETARQAPQPIESSTRSPGAPTLGVTPSTPMSPSAGSTARRPSDKATPRAVNGRATAMTVSHLAKGDQRVGAADKKHRFPMQSGEGSLVQFQSPRPRDPLREAPRLIASRPKRWRTSSMA
jgi:hypothetical protein